MMKRSFFLLIITYVAAVQKFYTQSTANTFGDFSLGAGYDMNRYEPKAAHLFKEGSDDLLYDIMPITSTKTRCALITKQKDISDKLHVHGSISIKYQMISGSGEITYDQKKETMSKVAYYTCTIDRTLYTISVNAPPANGDMENFLSANVADLEDEKEVKEVVGDYHIRSITYGRRYNTEIRMEYTTEDAFENIEGKLKASIGVGALKVSAEVEIEKKKTSFEEDLTLSISSEALGFVEAVPLFLPSKSIPKLDAEGKPMKDEDGKPIILTAQDQIDAMVQKNLNGFNKIDSNKTFKPKTGLNKSELFEIMDDAYPLWYTVEKNQPYFKKLAKLDPFEEQQMLRNLDQAYDIMRELEDMTENIQTRAALLFESYHLLSGATELSLEFLKYRQSLMNTIVEYRGEVLDYIELAPRDVAQKDIYFWAAEDKSRVLEYVSMDILHTRVWDLLGMEDVPMDDENEIGATCLFNGIQATIANSTDRRKFAGRVVFGDLTVRHVLFDHSGKVVSLGYIDHEHDNRDNETWSGVNHELVFVREDCTLLKKGADVWYQKSRYTISSIGSDEHLTPRGYVNKEKLTNIRLHLQPKDTTRQIEVVITSEEVKDVELRGHENSYGFTVDSMDRLMYKNGYVCDHLFQKKEANMICTALGYEDVLYYKTGYEIPAANAWGRPHITMTDLDCDLMARGVESCTKLTGEEMDQLQKPWTFCETHNGVQLKCVNNWVRNHKSFRMEVESKNVSCSRNQESMGMKIDTAEKCSGGAGDLASNFGHVEKVTVKGSICVKLIREDHGEDKLDCVVSEDSATWDFTNPDILNRFCYGDFLSLSRGELPFPEHIRMISAYREEPCADNDEKVKPAELKLTKVTANATADVLLENCKQGKEFGLCNEDGKFADDIKIDDSDVRTFLDLCPKTCGICQENPRKHYNVTVNLEESIFAVDHGETIIVTIDDEDSQTFESDSEETKKFTFARDFHCGEKIRIAAKSADGEYAHGPVTCSVQILMIEENPDARIEEGYVMIGGDIEVAFRCANPPTVAPSADQPTVTPTLPPSLPSPSTDRPTVNPTLSPSTPKNTASLIASQKRCGNNDFTSGWLDEYNLGPEGCASLILSQPQSICSHVFFHYADATEIADGNCGCVTPGSGCEDAEQLFGQGSTSTYMIGAMKVSSTSGHNVEMVPYSTLSVGDMVFSDRDYPFTHIGQYESNCYYLKGSNRDKDTPGTSVQWTIDAPFDSKVYLDFWRGQQHADSGFPIHGWSVSDKMGTQFSERGNLKGPGIVYEKYFSSGTIDLYGNNGDGFGTYYAFVCPSERKCVGVEQSTPETQRSYSSIFNGDEIGTGYAQSMIDSPRAWSALYNRAGEYVTIALAKTSQVMGVVTQGRRDSIQRVESYSIQTSIDGVTFEDYNEGEVFVANSDSDTKVYHEFGTAVVAQYIRFVVLSWNQRISMRADVLICSDSLPSLVASGKRCRTGFNVADGQIYSLEGCRSLILSQPESTCSHKFFMHATVDAGNGNCGCVAPETNCEAAENLVDQDDVSTYMIDRSN